MTRPYLDSNPETGSWGHAPVQPPAPPPSKTSVNVRNVLLAAVAGVVIGFLVLVGLLAMRVPFDQAIWIQAVIAWHIVIIAAGAKFLSGRRRGLLLARYLLVAVASLPVMTVSIWTAQQLHPQTNAYESYWLGQLGGASAAGLLYLTLPFTSGMVRYAKARPKLRMAMSAAILVVAIVFIFTMASLFPDATMTSTSIMLISVVSITMGLQLYAWRDSSVVGEDENIQLTDPGLRVVIFLAARKEASVIGPTLQRMVELKHPNFCVKPIINHRDDHETLAICKDYERRYPDIVQVVPYPENPKNSKPIGLNEAMRVMMENGEHYDIVGVADAEDRFHHELLATVDHLFRAHGAGVVQGAVQLVNFSVAQRIHFIPDGYFVAFNKWVKGLGAKLRGGNTDDIVADQWVQDIDKTGRLRARVQQFTTGWWRGANCLEYFKWFSSRLKFQADVGVIPLGGNTVFFSKEFMDTLHRRYGTWWDEHCLTEDCKIGIIASALGFPVVVHADPRLATLEETPESLGKFVKQRVRWMQGFIQVFFEAEWLTLPSIGQRLLAMYVIGFQFFQALTAVLVPVAIFMALLHDAPVALVLLATLPLMIGFWSIVLDAVLLNDFGNEFAPATPQQIANRRFWKNRNNVKFFDFVGIIIGNYFFQAALAVSAIWAAYRYLAGINNWVKTDHSGAHLAASDLAPAPSEGVHEHAVRS